MSVKSYQQLTRLPPPPPSPRTKPALMKTLSAPQAALSRLLGSGGSRGAPEDGRGGGEGDGGGGRASGKRRSKKKRPIEVGEDVLASETPPSASPPLPAAIPEGNLIDLDTDDASSTSESSPSATSLSSYPPSFRSCSVGNGDRPSPQSRRRPPPPPPQRTRLATVSGALSTEKSSPGVKHRPTPPPKPSYLSSPPAEQEHAPTSVPVSDTDGVKAAVTKPEAKPRSSAAQVPSPYITFTPLRSKPEPPPRIRQDSPTSPDSTTSLNSSPTKSTAPVPSSPEENTTPPASSTTVPTHPLHPVTFPNPPPREMEYTEREHSRNVFEYLNKMRRRGDLCDVTLMSSTREIRAHKAVLAACSQYFESMFIGEFAEPDGEPIIVEEIEDDALEALVDFAYTSRIKLTDRNIYLIFAAADLLQFSGVRGACFKFFKQQMNKSNCIRTWLFGDGHNCTELTDAALRYIESNFLDVVRGREFLSLDRADVVARLLGLEDIAVTTEEQVYEATLNWLRHDLENRASDALEVMKSVRFPNMSRDYLLHITETEDIIKENPQCLQMLIEALESFVSGTRTRLRKMMMKKREKEATMTYINVKPRNASMAVETVEFCRGNYSLGLRIMGGNERPFHVFRQGDKPGIFILMVTPDGAAAKTGKLRTGDRILKVNGTDVSTATHDQAIRLLKTSSDPLSLCVRHEPAPPGLQELTLVTKPGEGFGLSLSGGVNGYHGNPLDETDEGLFISQVIPGGTAERDGRLREGTRILQVNSISLLGKTLAEAIQVFQGVLDRINLLVCVGYDPASDAVVSRQQQGEEGGGGPVDESGFVQVGSESLYDWRTAASGSGGGSSDGVLV